MYEIYRPPDTAILVKLDPHEMAAAAYVGVRRHLGAVTKGLQEKHGCDGSWDHHILGAMGELALAKWLGVYWAGTVDVFKRVPDVAGVEVRTRPRHDYDLIIRDDDDEERVYVLVTGRGPEFRLRGWVKGLESRDLRWRKDHGGREDAWFVPQDALHPMDELPTLTR